MSNARGNNNVGSFSEYEKRRMENIKIRIKRKRGWQILKLGKQPMIWGSKVTRGKLERKIISQVLQQVKVQTCAQDHKETMLNYKRIRLLLIYIQLEISLVTMMMNTMLT